MEIKNINDFDNYCIDINGNVYNKKDLNKPLCKWIDNVGYYQVILYKNGKRQYKRVHKLVAETFLENPNNLPQVNHIDGNKLNNNIHNLEWISNKDNTQHGYNNKLYKSTYKCRCKAIHKLTNEEFEFESIRSMANELRLNRKTITAILKNSKTNNYDYDFEYID